jgi:hypothetical protein
MMRGVSWGSGVSVTQSDAVGAEVAVAGGEVGGVGVVVGVETGDIGEVVGTT